MTKREIYRHLEKLGYELETYYPSKIIDVYFKNLNGMHRSYGFGKTYDEYTRIICPESKISSQFLTYGTIGNFSLSEDGKLLEDGEEVW